MSLAAVGGWVGGSLLGAGSLGTALGSAAGGMIGGSLFGGEDQAYGQQAAGVGENAAVQKYIFDKQREDQQPYRDLASQVGIPGMRNLLASDAPLTAAQVMAEPGYEFGRTQGLNALQGAAAARGGLYSGAAGRALTKFGNDYATKNFGESWNRMESGLSNRYNRFANAAGMGQAATNQVGAAGQNYANSVGGAAIGLGNAGAAASMSSSNNTMNALNRASSYMFGGGGGLGSGGGSGQTSNMFSNAGYFSNALNGYDNNDVYWN